MLPISNLLNRFKNLTNNEKVKKQLITEIVIENKIPININQVSIVKNTIIVKVQPIIKTEILLKKEKIIAQINEIPGLTFINNIQ